MRRGSALAFIALATLACGPPRVWTGVSPDHRRAFTVAEREGEACVTVDGADSQCFDGVALSQIAFSENGRSMAYPALRGDRWVVVHDGVPGPENDAVGEVVFSPDGSRLAYTAARNGAWHVVVDGEYGQPYDSLFAGTLMFDDSGARHAFAAVRAGRAVAVVDGRDGPPRDGIAQMRFSPDGARIAYVGRVGARVSLELDGAPGATHEAILEYVFDAAGARVAYVARDAGSAWVVDDGERLGPFVQARDLAYRPADGELVFVAKDAEGERVVAGGVPGERHEAVDRPVFASGGAAWGYIAHDTASSVVVLAGRVVDERSWAGDLALSRDGARYAYLTRRDEADVVIHDRGVTEFDLVVDGTLQFTDQGVWACLAGDVAARRLYAVVEGRRSTRRFEWSDLPGVAEVGAPTAAEAVRRWVAAAAAILLEEPRPGT